MKKMNPRNAALAAAAVAAWVLVPVAQAATLTVTSGLEMWLKSDTGVTTATGNRVTTWADQETTVVENATQGTDANRPILTTATIGNLTNHPVIHFDGFDDISDSYADTQANRDFMNFTLAGANTYSGMTFFIVAQGTHTPLRSPDNAAVQFIVSSGGAASPGIRWAMGLGNNGITNPAALGWAGTAGSPQLGTGVVLSPNTTYITSYVKTKGAGSGWTLAVNGTSFVGNPVADTSFPTANFNGIIGGESSVVDYAFTGDVAEILIYNRALTTTEVGDVYDYLDDRYFPVPEPAGLAILSLGALALMNRRQRK